MSHYNIAATQYKNEQMEGLRQRINQRMNNLQDFSSNVQASKTRNTTPTFASLMQPVHPSSDERQKHTAAVSSFFKDVNSLLEALQAGDKKAMKHTLAQMQVSVKDMLAKTPHAAILAADLKILSEALQTSDPAVLQAAMLQFQTDCQSLYQTFLQASPSGLEAAVSALQTTFDANLNRMLASVETDSANISGAINTGLKKFLNILSSVNTSPLVAAGIAGLASVIGGRINTSA